MHRMWYVYFTNFKFYAIQILSIWQRVHLIIPINQILAHRKQMTFFYPSPSCGKLNICHPEISIDLNLNEFFENYRILVDDSDITTATLDLSASVHFIGNLTEKQIFGNNIWDSFFLSHFTAEWVAAGAGITSLILAFGSRRLTWVIHDELPHVTTA